jgi:Ser/Thr protein kinase RdoA (MazF antagonist)
MVEVPNEIKDLYGLSPDFEWEYIGDGYMNKTWLGKSNDVPVYALRQYVRTQDRAEILLEHQLLLYLEKECEFVAQPMFGKNLETLQEIDGEQFALFPYIEGEQMERHVFVEIVPASTALAKLHALLAAYQAPPNFATLRPGLLQQKWEIEPEAAQFLANSPDTALLRRNGFNLPWLETQVKVVESNLETIKLERPFLMVVHGDYSPRNILWHPQWGEMAVVLDWDETRFDLPVTDIVATAKMFGKNEELEDIFIGNYLSQLKILDELLAETVRYSLKWKKEIYHAGRVAELLLNMRVSVFKQVPFSAGYALKVAQEINEQN